MVVTVVVASIGGVAGVPGTCVEGAVRAERDTVLGEDVAGEKVARLVFAIRIGMRHVVIGLSFAGRGTERGVVWVIVKQTHAGVGIVAIVQGRVDSCWEADRSLEIFDGRRRLHFAVTIATRNHNLKVLTPTTGVGSSSGGDGISIEGAFDVVGGSRVRAVWSRVERRIAFKEYVEAETELLTVAGISTALNIITCESFVCQVANLLGASALVGK